MGQPRGNRLSRFDPAKARHPMMESMLQTTARLPRTANRPPAGRHGSDPLSRPARLWTGCKGTTKEAQFIRQVRADLVQHVGGKPSAVERILIERAVMMTVHLARMDAAALAADAMSDHARREYLAWDGKLRQALRQLGKPAAAKPPSLADYIAAGRQGPDQPDTAA